MSGEIEIARLDALRQLDLLDTPPSEAFDRITRMAAQIFGLPIAAVSLTDQDRQWFKSRVGISHNFIPRDRAPCAQVAEETASLVVPDLLSDPCYRNSHLGQSGVRFYAGVPLVTREGFGLGALCVLGHEPRQASSSEMASLADLASMVMAQIELQHAFGRVDPLSGMPNRNQFLEDLEDLARDRPAVKDHQVVLVDLATPEQLSAAARVLGSSHVDAMVKHAARRIRAHLGTDGKAYHVSMTQFALLMPAAAQKQGRASWFNGLLCALAAATPSSVAVTTVIGVAPFVLGQEASSEALRRAHNAVEDARSSKREVSFYSATLDLARRRRFTLLEDFPLALASEGQLRLVYQPRVDLASRRCAGAEALLRWTHPTLGEVSPGEFIPLIEHTALSRHMTEWVIDAALVQLSAWRAEGLNTQLSANVMAPNLLEADFAVRVAALLERHDLPASCLELEITEGSILENTEQVLETLAALDRIGIRLAIDDFGTGYSSLSYLRRLPAQVTKIDRSFMQDLVDDDKAKSLVVAVISLSHGLGYRVVAEGVETAEQEAILRCAACDEAQGYFFARPLAPAEFAAWCSGRQDV